MILGFFGLDKKTNSNFNTSLFSLHSPAFTLAEVLITLGIIGIIASMTIPTLISKTSDAELKTAWKKNYSILSQAFSQVVTDNGGSIEGAYTGDLKGSETFKNNMRAKLSYVKDCSGTSDNGGTGGGASADGCWHAANKWGLLNGTPIGATVEPSLILKDGTLVRLEITKTDCSDSIGSYTRCGYIYLDVNGFKKPNVAGKDIFAISALKDILLPAGAKGTLDTANPAITCIQGSTAETNNGYGCSAKYLYE